MTNIARIEKLVFGGHGLCRDDRGVILIPDVLRGEVVEYQDAETRGGTRTGRAVRILEKSPARREPPCVHAGVCGGCDWQFMQYDEQLRAKKEIFLDCIKRIGKFDCHPQDIEIFCANEFGYRIRAQIKIDPQNRHAGFFKRKTNDVVKIDNCPLLSCEINNTLAKLNSDASALRNLSKNAKAIKMLAGKTVASAPVIKNLTAANTEIKVGNVNFFASGGSFFQSNKFLLETFGSWARGKLGGGNCLDLYGGVGFFSLMLGDDFENVTLVENVPAQVRAAGQNFARNKKNHITATLADLDKITTFEKLTAGRSPNCIIVDPPRPGLTKNARNLLLNAAPPVILYVSCNPSTFARDAGALVRGGYKISQWALFDMYPNTHHIESAATLERDAINTVIFIPRSALKSF